ncbi:protein of unknown function [Aminobacter niigataensis]|nr:protein of unknown function [Aminobacter niigataensis]
MPADTTPGHMRSRLHGRQRPMSACFPRVSFASLPLLPVRLEMTRTDASHLKGSVDEWKNPCRHGRLDVRALGRHLLP